MKPSRLTHNQRRGCSLGLSLGSWFITIRSKPNGDDTGARSSVTAANSGVAINGMFACCDCHNRQV